MKIELKKEEALVLLEWLCKKEQCDDLVKDDAAKFVVWNLICQLEKELVETHHDNYPEILAKAKEFVIKNY